MSKVIVVIGAQWGDEGKGKIVDLLAEHFEIVARYQGGHNAGHSVQVGDRVLRACTCCRPGSFIPARPACLVTAW